MSQTFCAEIHHLFEEVDGEFQLKPALQTKHSILQTESGIRLEVTLAFVTEDETWFPLNLCDSVDDPFFQTHFLFTGFYSTGVSIMEALGIPSSEYEVY